MNILVIAGYCLKVNSSANLCHLSYITGLLNCGHTIDLLTVDEHNFCTDPSIVIPPINSYTTYKSSLYERLGELKKQRFESNSSPISVNTQQSPPSKNKLLLTTLKSSIRKLYGAYGPDIIWYHNAKRFQSKTNYDCVISLAFPPTSHKLAGWLLKKKHIKASRWIQIWEDPWFSDVYGHSYTRAAQKAEQKLLSQAQRICYVSPLTLKNQQRLYPESADKMFWQPLPYYYKNEATPAHTGPNVYGYFGDYAPVARNLEPFYQAAKETGIRVEICGNPCNLFPATDSIHIHPRLPLHELKPIEDSANVLIFLCNHKGGQIPGKIYQYSATEKTVLFILDGTEEEQQVLREFFEPFDRYVFCENTAEDITRAIRDIEAGNLHGVKNRPLEDFAPQKTIHNILNG